MKESADKSNPNYIAVNGELRPYGEGHLHLMSPGAKYGLNVFEGMRAYWNDDHQQLYVFAFCFGSLAIACDHFHF